MKRFAIVLMVLLGAGAYIQRGAPVRDNRAVAAGTRRRRQRPRRRISSSRTRRRSLSMPSRYRSCLRVTPSAKPKALR